MILTGDVIDCRAFSPSSPKDCWEAAFQQAIAPVVAAGGPLHPYPSTLPLSLHATKQNV